MHNFLILLIILLASCQDEINKKNYIDLYGKKNNLEYYCPDGYDYYENFNLCIIDETALGPFPTSMIQKCISIYGEDLCDIEKLPYKIALHFKNQDNCPDDLKRDTKYSICHNEKEMFGPFKKELVQECIKNHEDLQNICTTMKWPVDQITFIVPDEEENDYYELESNFNLPEFKKTTNDLSLWATYYYLPEVKEVSQGYPLRDLHGNTIGPVLTKKDWCYAAMEGSVKVEGYTTYNYAGTSSFSPVDCSEFFSWDVSRTKFKVAKGKYGDGVKNFILVPFRTIAVDKRVIDYGSIIYIPSARGAKIELENGDKFTHDGYFFAGDTGGAIIDDHIDVYIGLSEINPFNFVKSNSSETFKAYIVDNKEIIQVLTEKSISE